MLKSKGKGATFLQVTRSDIEELPLTLPCPDEQRHIVAILDKADAIRRKRREALKLADDFLKSVFLDMFGDPVTNPKGWEQCGLKDIGEITTGNTPPRNDDSNYGDHLEWIKSDNITTQFHYLTQAKERISEKAFKRARIVNSGAILVTCIAGSRDCIGNAAISNRQVSFNQQINAISPYDTNMTNFIYTQIFSNKKLIQQASTNSMKGLVSKNKFENIKLIFPQNKSLIYYFSDIASSIMNMQNELYVQLKESEILFKSLEEKFLNQ